MGDAASKGQPDVLLGCRSSLCGAPGDRNAIPEESGWLQVNPVEASLLKAKALPEDQVVSATISCDLNEGKTQISEGKTACDAEQAQDTVHTLVETKMVEAPETAVEEPVGQEAKVTDAPETAVEKSVGQEASAMAPPTKAVIGKEANGEELAEPTVVVKEATEDVVKEKKSPTAEAPRAPSKDAKQANATDEESSKKRQAEEAKKKAQVVEARRKSAMEEATRKKAAVEAETRRKAEEEARRKAEEEAKQREEEAQKKKDDEARKKAQEELAKKFMETREEEAAEEETLRLEAERRADADALAPAGQSGSKDKIVRSKRTSSVHKAPMSWSNKSREKRKSRRN